MVEKTIEAMEDAIAQMIAILICSDSLGLEYISNGEEDNELIIKHKKSGRAFLITAELIE